MAELYENKEAARERVILVGVCTRENENVEESLDELAELAFRESYLILLR